MKYFQTGNVIRLKDDTSIVIVVKYTYEYIEWIPINYANTTGHTKLSTYTKEVDCRNCDKNDGGVGLDSNGEECQQCLMTGRYKQIFYGAEEAEFIASNVKEYIINSLTKNFNF
jgi:hypothetical protein